MTQKLTEADKKRVWFKIMKATTNVNQGKKKKDFKVANALPDIADTLNGDSEMKRKNSPWIRM